MPRGRCAVPAAVALMTFLQVLVVPPFWYVAAALRRPRSLRRLAALHILVLISSSLFLPSYVAPEAYDVFFAVAARCPLLDLGCAAAPAAVVPAPPGRRTLLTADTGTASP